VSALRRHAVTIVLVLLAVGLGAYLWFDRDAVTQGERKRRENNVFSAWRRDELAKIELTHGGETLVLERDAKKDSPWRMTSPRQERADQAAAERLTTTFEFASVVRKVDPGTNMGFDAPRATGAITMGGLVLRFALGAPSPRPEGSSYLRVEGEAPVVVSRELADALLAPFDTYRDRTVVPYLSLDLSRFEAKHDQGGFALERLDDHAFKVADLGVLASREAIDKVWAALADMRAESFPKDADADRLTASPRLTLVMTPKDASKGVAELVVGDACPGHGDDVVVVRRSPSRVAACAPKGILDALRAAPQSLVEKRPFTIHPDELEELRLEWVEAGDAGAGTQPLGRSAAAPRAIEIARKGSGFHMREPEDRDLDEMQVDAAGELVARILRSEAEVVVRGGAEPFAPVARARVRFGGERLQTVEIGAASPSGRVVARRVLDGAKIELAAPVARRFVPRETSLRARTLLGDTRRVVRVLLRCGAPQEIVDRGEGLRLVDPRGYETDGTIVQLVDALTRGKVDAWTSDTPSPEQGLSSDACRVVLGFEGGNDPKTVRFGDEEGEGATRGVFGQVEGAPFVFVAPRSLREMASRWYVSRAALRTDPASIAQVRVVRGGLASPDPEAAREAAGALVAERVVSVGKRDVGREELVVEVVVSDGGAPRRIACGARAADAKAARRLCSVSGVDAVFEVAEGRLAAFTGKPDAGAAVEVARDGGAR
jgi:hypothetical protein